MTVCCVIGCKTRSDTRKQSGITLHKFPKNVEIRQAWIKTVDRDEDWSPSNCSVVCSLHFQKSCFDKTGKYVKLHPDAVPSLINRNPPYYKNQRRNCRPIEKEISQNPQSPSTKDGKLAPGNAHVIRVIPDVSQNNNPTEQDDLCESESQDKDTELKKHKIDDDQKDERNGDELQHLKRRKLENVVNEKKNGRPLRKGIPRKLPHTEVVTYIVCDDNTVLSDIQTLLPELSKDVRCVTQNEDLHLKVVDNNTASGNVNVVQASPSVSQLIESVSRAERHCEILQDQKDLLAKLTNLEIEVRQLRDHREKAKKKVKSLCQRQRRYAKKIAALKDSIASLKQHRSVDREKLEILNNVASPLIELLDRQRRKKMENVIQKEYSPHLREFVSTLYSISPRAYRYVRKVFDMCLPHQRTIKKWKQKGNNGLDFMGHDCTDESNFTDDENNSETDFTNEESNSELDFTDEESNGEPELTGKESNDKLDLINQENYSKQSFLTEKSNDKFEFSYQRQNTEDDFTHLNTVINQTLQTTKTIESQNLHIHKILLKQSACQESSSEADIANQKIDVVNQLYHPF